MIVSILAILYLYTKGALSGNVTKEVQLQAPAVACPRDTTPYITQGKAKECVPSEPDACPSGFICYFDSVDDKYICCGKLPGYCEAGQPYTNPSTSQPQECRLDASSNVCQSPYRCESRNTGSNVGFCCLNLEGIEPPPVGCPWGTRPLKDRSQTIITCVPGTTNACPGEAICYFDTVERTNRCCGRDPGEGCPTGTRAYKRNNQILNCVPGDAARECPELAVCQWSYLIDRFQCCQADNGCPVGANPLVVNGVAQMCQRDQPNACPQQYNCEFNFWIASYQCCGPNTGFCPVGQVPYLETGTNQARTCVQTQPGICPTGYNCQQSSTSQFVCCGQAGQCPSGTTLATDSLGRARSCSPTTSGGCPALSNCVPGIGGAAGHYLCCSSGISNQCPSGYSPQNGQIIQCISSSPVACTSGSACLQSPSQPSLFLCCSQGTTSSQCPSGYQLQNNQLTYCNPSSPTACFAGAQCLPLTAQPTTYICCSPSSLSNQCPSGYSLQNGQVTPCSSSSPFACTSGSACLQSPSQPSLFLCCSQGTTSSQCPSGYQLQNNQITYCNPSTPTACFGGAQCLPSTAQPTTYICCSQFSSNQCPSGYSLQNNQMTTCSPSSPTTSCFGGSLCLQSPSNPSMFLCCTQGAMSSQCPSGYSLLNGQVVSCNPSSPTSCFSGSVCLQSSTSTSTFLCCTQGSGGLQCPSGYILQNNVATTCFLATTCFSGNLCLQSVNQPTTTICCSPQTSTGQCPIGARLQNGVVTPCSITTSTSTCSFGSFCLNSIMVSGTQICCTVDNPSTVQCPAGFQLPSGVAQQCNPSFPNCASGSSCLQSSTISGAYICCSQGSGGIQCPSGYMLQNGVVTPCTPSLSACISGSFCLASPSQPNMFLCCSQGSSNPTCPSGYNLQGGVATFCNPSQPNCVLGSQCLAALGSASSFLCCTTGTSTQYVCPNNLTPYMVGPNFYFCTQSAPNCPAGSSCQQATNVAGLFLCCQGNVDGQYQCPANTRPLMTGSAYSFCNPTSGPFCPSTYSCQQATNTPNVYICCSTSLLAPTCPSNLSPYVVSAGQYVYCSATNTFCPGGASCQTATNMANTYICCTSSSTSFSCPGNLQIFISTSGQPTYCTSSASSCPTSSICLQSQNDPGISVCCQTTSGQVCPFNQQPLYITNQLQYCTSTGATCPSFGYTCQFASALSRFVCCGTGSSSDICPSGLQPLYFGTQLQFCTSTGATCPTVGYSCQFSNVINQFVCCGGSTSALRCANNQQMYQPSTTPFLCNPSASQCPAQYDCSPSTLPNQNVCCLRMATGSYQCISGRQPYPNSANPTTCTPSAPNCPAGTACESSNFPNQFICCNLGSRQPQCPDAMQPLLDGVSPRRCSGPSDTTCGSPYQCVASDIASTYICCQFSGGLRCFTGAQPYLLSNGQPQQCSAASPNCPPNYSCQSSTQPGTLICCGASSQGNVFCPDGGQPYRTGTQVFYCGVSVSCPQTYQCLQSTVPAYQVCCLRSQQATICLPGQQPLLVNNQPQQCRIINPQCGQGYNCQQGTSGTYYCCQAPLCSSGSSLMTTNGQPRYCNPASSSCPSDSNCQQAANLPGNFICCVQSTALASGLARCIGRTTSLTTGQPLPCSVTSNTCPTGSDCSSFTTTGGSICCVTVIDQGADPVCPSGEPFKDAATKQFHYCSATNYACPQGFVCKQMMNAGDQYLCCSSKKTCQFGWAPFVDRSTNLPLECNPGSPNSCSPQPGPPYKCQQSTVPGEYLCCMETMIAFGTEDNETATTEPPAPSVVQKIKRIFG